MDNELPPAPSTPSYPRITHCSRPTAGPPGTTSETTTELPDRSRIPEMAMPKPLRGSWGRIRMRPPQPLDDPPCSAHATTLYPMPPPTTTATTHPTRPRPIQLGPTHYSSPQTIALPITISLLTKPVLLPRPIQSGPAHYMPAHH